MTASPLDQLSIDRKDQTPIYQQIALQLEALIAQGAWQPDERLPSDTVLSRHLGTSTMTVRQAIFQLVYKNLVIRIQGRGTFLLPKTMTLDSQHLRGFTDDARTRLYTPSGQILDFQLVRPVPNICEQLALDADQQAISIRRLRFVNGQVAADQQVYLSYLDLSRDELEHVGSLYEVLAQKGVILVEALETIRAIQADEESARLLQVKPGAPLLSIDRLSMDTDGRRIEYSMSKTRGDIYSYSVRIRRHLGP